MTLVGTRERIIPLLQINNVHLLMLSNGEAVWDIAGNVSEWTNSSNISTGSHPGVSCLPLGWQEWNAADMQWGFFPQQLAGQALLVLRLAGGGLHKVSERSIVNREYNGLSRILRGGSIGNPCGAGILAVTLGTAPSASTYMCIGFGVANKV